MKEQSLVLFVFWEERARTTELSLQVEWFRSVRDQLASGWVALGLIPAISNIVPRNDLWDSCP